jgi:hypothetical protein
MDKHICITVPKEAFFGRDTGSADDTAPAFGKPVNIKTLSYSNHLRNPFRKTIN